MTKLPGEVSFSRFLRAMSRFGWTVVRVKGSHHQLQHADVANVITVYASRGTISLHYAVTIARADLVTDLVQRGTDMEARDDLGYSPMVLAAFKGRTLSLRILLGAGANARAQDRKRNTALMFAAQSGDLEAIKLLLAAGADVAVRGQSGYTALKVAHLCSQHEAAKLLAAHGAPE